MTRRVLVATGTRAEFGLLEPVIRAIDAHPDLGLLVAAGGAHFLPPASTIEHVRERVRVDATFEMQRPGEVGRLADAAALGRGVTAFAGIIEKLQPDWLVVLGDRIEAFAAASAASVAGVPTAHLHGGDRAEGVADEAMRHAITKLAHLHLPATETSAERITRMGEDPERVHAIGSPAIDALAHVQPMSDEDHAACASPDTLFLMHPRGRPDDEERAAASQVLSALTDRRVLALHPNHDPGRAGVVAAIRDAAVPESQHMPRDQFLSLLKRLAQTGALIVGNSSAGLIECAALKLPAVNVGDRQSGRESADNAVHAEETHASTRAAIEQALTLDRATLTHPYGDGNTGKKAASAIAEATNTHDPAALTRKRNRY